ncbi:UDP-3-O-(3-hydroxymyristoyl)glucosamine N-acyltransferase [Paenibacillus koleovorans]|uniref:UDP-3-O-(3-hydroxymyristoyl)glucosamine N-acyltransferase n=1 Tax=Paenibacillus koleovorans TaxID=121608 RepID=UPI000FD76EED|nr:UDP-3-O-(3-hydroxymyristoyl)glucosamine N-acyltransferase [Paenibacillus koleovorans]
MHGSFKIKELLDYYESIGCLVERIELTPEQAKREITGFSSLYESRPGTLTWMKGSRFDGAPIRSAALVCPAGAEADHADDSLIRIPVHNPRNAFALAMRRFYPFRPLVGIAPTARIGHNCSIGESVYIGEYAVVGDDVTIGGHTQIHSHVSIHDQVAIGSQCIVHSGTVIGADGFGYELDEEGKAFKFPHIGGVQIGDGVEIGSNCCIARGVLANTVIGDHTKIGNLTHVSHNVEIGEHVMITHQTHLSGSTRIGERSWIAPGAVLREGIEVGAHAFVGLGAVVIRDVNPHEVVAGVPAKPLKKE